MLEVSVQVGSLEQPSGQQQMFFVERRHIVLYRILSQLEHFPEHGLFVLRPTSIIFFTLLH